MSKISSYTDPSRVNTVAERKRQLLDIEERNRQRRDNAAERAEVLHINRQSRRRAAKILSRER